MSLDTYERSEADRELCYCWRLRRKEIAGDVGHSLDSVLAEADALFVEKLIVQVLFTPSARLQFLQFG